MRIWLSALALVLLGAAGQAADCSGPLSDVRRAICGDAALAALDERLAAAYGEVAALSDAKGRGMLARSQDRWLQARSEACPASEAGLSACIREMTEQRLGLLSGRPQDGTPLPRRVVPVFILQDGSPTQFALDLTMLRILDPKTAADRRFNAVADSIAAQAKIGPHGQDSRGQVYTTIVATDLRLASPRLVSLEESYWSFTGGAHGYGGTNSYNFDPVSGRDYEIGDLFPEAAAARLAADCKAQLVAERQRRGANPQADGLVTDDVVAEHVATLGAWSFTQEEAIIGFDSEIIGSHAEGAYACRFSMSALKKLALPGSPLP